jgi:DNA repair protein RadC
MRVFECKLSYALVSLGEEIQLNRSDKIADYLRSAFDENPLQEAFYCVYLDRKNHPLGRHLISLGTLDSTLMSCREVFRGAILAGASALVVSELPHKRYARSLILPGSFPIAAHRVAILAVPLRP